MTQSAALRPPPSDDQRPYDVLCLGLNANDNLLLVESFPAPGQKLQVRELATSGGGQAATAACALARLGHRVAYAGVCGDDPAGCAVAPGLESFGVDPRGLKVVPGAGSQQAFILVQANDGERTIIWYRDQACRLEPSDLDPDLISQARVLHLDGHFLEVSLAAARLARGQGLLVSLDGERVYPGSQELVSLCQVVVGSRSFAQRLTGIDDPRRALEALAELGPAWVGRTMGHQGAELLADGQYYFQPAFAVQAMDTTGAGDVFHGGLVHALLLGQDPAQALATASAAAALSVTAMGGRGCLADRAALQDFLARRQP